MDISTEINVLLARAKSNQTELAKVLGTTQGNLGNKLKRNNWRVNEVEEIAEKLGYEMKISFVKKAE